MNGPVIPPSSVVDHLTLTLIPLLVGLLIGGALGSGTGFGLRALYSSAPGARKWLGLLPWRTVIAGCLIFSSTLILVLILGMNPVTPVFGVSVTVTLLAWIAISSAVVEVRFRSPLSVRLLSLARTLAVMTVIIATVIGQLSDMGLGAALYRSVMMQFNYGAMVPALSILIAFALVLDLVFGIAQLVATTLAGNSQAAPAE